MLVWPSVLDFRRRCTDNVRNGEGRVMGIPATERLEMRLRPEASRYLREAAELEQTSVSRFLLDAGLARADEVIAAHRTWTVPVVIFDELIGALDAPPVINKVLAKAAAAANELIERR
jgi:uncharacterized protein (DUF1778 family)